MIINECDAKKPTIYKCDHCKKLVESYSMHNNREGHVCPYCNMGTLHRHTLPNPIYMKGKAYKIDIKSSDSEIKYR